MTDIHVITVAMAEVDPSHCMINRTHNLVRILFPVLVVPDNVTLLENESNADSSSGKLATISSVQSRSLVSVSTDLDFSF